MSIYRPTKMINVVSTDWITVFKSLTNAFFVSAYGGFSGYILKNLLTDSNGNFLGIPTKS